MVVVVRSYWPQSLYCQMDKTGDCGRTSPQRNIHPDQWQRSRYGSTGLDVLLQIAVPPAPDNGRGIPRPAPDSSVSGLCGR